MLAAGGTRMWAGARSAPAAGAASRRRPVGTNAGQRELSLSSGGRQPRPAPAPAWVADAKQPYYIHEPFVAQHTVPTDCRLSVMQREIKRPFTGCIAARFSDQNRYFGSITSLLPVSPSLLLSLLFIRP